ncbi:ricin-type beta-trefoil lectin domain protein [Kibdelosporangium philippinense]|uniref:Ricin-type beta-trefoil lectin domain protein n=1 Tax=Kibdelosporangium philippinense TaxID=211113 RepID=A0ABS8Z4C2_9PSEU|nr:ricin-type beta-trefoil lectin domain protein [Kibdelosporangium philippinense]MCE7001428.1 ricin-type beta-trefoil lectin domain protein [Kibdelosporangium philippinense]
MPKNRRNPFLFGALSLFTLTALAIPTPAQAAGETVNIWLTTTNDADGVNVTRGLQQQTPVNFAAGNGSGAVTITVNENTQYQPFEGAGASFTDSAAWLMNSSNILSANTRDEVMRRLFDPNTGIGVSFIRNPMGGSDLARFSYTYDDMPAGQTDPNLTRFNINHDLADVVPLTRQALQLNPAATVMGSPWSVPPWMKDNDDYKLGWVESQYYPALAQYFVKYAQAYAAQGIPIKYVTVNNEPTCCASYPSTMWNGSGLQVFTKNNLLPALQGAGLSTKALALDWNWDKYNEYAAPTVNDAAIRNHPNFGGVAWHGYGGNVSQQTTVQNQYPGIPQYGTEMSGGLWVGNQHTDDMNYIINTTRNYARTVTKWSLAMDQNHNPHNGGCNQCTGLVTVHNGDSRHGQVDYTIEYYTMGHLTKFVKPGARRIQSNDNASVKNVAWRNADGSKALLAYNTTGSTQSVRVNWGGQSFTYNLPSRTSATFTWTGTQSGGGGGGGQITGLAGKCVDVAGANSANGTAVQLYDCNGTGAQQWTRTGSQLQSLGKCLDVSGGGTANGTVVQIWDCNGSGAQQWNVTASNDIVNAQANKCLDVTGNNSANGTRLQIWECTGAANQKWTVPAP